MRIFWQDTRTAPPQNNLSPPPCIMQFRGRKLRCRELKCLASQLESGGKGMNPRACVWPLTLHRSPTFQGFWVCLGSLSVADGTHDKKLSGGPAHLWLCSGWPGPRSARRSCSAAVWRCCSEGGLKHSAQIPGICRQLGEAQPEREQQLRDPEASTRLLDSAGQWLLTPGAFEQRHHTLS